jgi:ribosome-associated protein
MVATDEQHPRQKDRDEPVRDRVRRCADALTVEQAVLAAEAASSKTLEPTVVIDVGDLIAITDYFVVASGTNDRQVRAIADEVEHRVKKSGGPSPRRVEGLDDARWVLMDYGDFVVHVFDREARSYYDLERLWGDAQRVDWEAEVGAARL